MISAFDNENEYEFELDYAVWDYQLEFMIWGFVYLHIFIVQTGIQ
jgi:hypothetical protein